MWTLTIQTPVEQTTKTLNQREVVIGNSTSDIPVKGEHIQQRHIRLIVENDLYFAINEAQDTSVTINQLPFKKQELLSNDVIEIEETKITVHVDKQDVNQSSQHKEQDSTHQSSHIKSLLVFALLTTFCTFLVILGVYLKASGKISQLEKRVTASVADIAVALTYAYINDTPPPDKNWLRHDFLQDTYTAILSPRLSPLAAIDSKGTYIDLPYILRVYSSDTKHRFILIAQPNPNILRWLIPNHAIVIDSDDMILRRLPNLKNVNRLLAHDNPLDGQNGQSISNELRNASIISASELIGHKNRWGFQIPQDSPTVDRVYNAPRYHLMGEEFIEKSINLSLQIGTKQELEKWHYEINKLVNLPGMTLFTTLGRKRAWKAKRAFVHLYPEKQQVIGTVKLGRQGFIEEAHVLPEISTEKDVAMLFGKQRTLNKPALSSLVLKLEQQQLQRTQKLTPLAYEMHILINRQKRTHQTNFQEQMNVYLKQWEEEQQQEEINLIKTLKKLLSQNPSNEFIDWLELTGYKKLLLKEYTDRAQEN